MKPISKVIYLGLLALCATAHAAEKLKTYRAPRLPDGHADMQGVWNNSNLTPLERPLEFTTLAIAAADAKRLEARYYLGPGGPNQPDDPGRVLEARSFEPIRGEFRSSQIIDPDNGHIPWNEVYKEKPAAQRRTVLTAFDNPEERPPLERCLASSGAPPMQPTGDANMYLIVQTPPITVILSELFHDARMIRMNATHSPAAITSWLGDSVGWWEGNTLIVETKYFSASSAIRSTGRHFFLVSSQTTVIEKFTRMSDNELNYVFIVTDPTYYTRAWTGETHLMRSNRKIFEYACHEGNYSLRNELEAARDQDAKEASTLAPTRTK
jgi:hypothetical protein